MPNEHITLTHNENVKLQAILYFIEHKMKDKNKSLATLARTLIKKSWCDYECNGIVNELFDKTYDSLSKNLESK